MPPQPPHPAPENAWARVPPAPANNQLEDRHPPGGAAEPGRVQNPHHIDVAYQSVIDHHPQPPLPNPPYIFPDVRHAQGIPGPVQVQPDAPVNQEHNPFGYGPPHGAPGLGEAAFHHRPYVHRVPTPYPHRQAGAETLRQLVRHYLHHPDAGIRMINMEAGPGGRITVAVVFETADF